MDIVRRLIQLVDYHEDGARHRTVVLSAYAVHGSDSGLAVPGF